MAVLRLRGCTLAEAEEAERGVADIARGDLAPVALAALAVDLRHLAGHRQHQRHGVIGHSFAVGAHRAADLDAVFLAVIHVDVVYAHAVLGDGAQLRRGGEYLRVQRVHADDDAHAVRQHFLHGFFFEDAAGGVFHHFVARRLQLFKQLGHALAVGARGGQYLFLHGLRLLSGRAGRREPGARR